ncbi:helix-turn-helix domain-containing protein [Streptomyces chumphonensis]|uniref:helix-turn-helix domain-containing protein n=1 Tax=Streptomyces chumphonensis TaxID=1214925 RepID=UPI003D758F14
MKSDPRPSWVSEYRRDVGERVRTARRDANLSQEALAHSAGVSRKTISRVELGEHATRLDHLLLIASVLQLPPGQLLPDRPPPPPAF